MVELYRLKGITKACRNDKKDVDTVLCDIDLNSDVRTRAEMSRAQIFRKKYHEVSAEVKLKEPNHGGEDRRGGGQGEQSHGNQGEWSFLHRPDSNRRHFPGLILAVHLF